MEPLLADHLPAVPFSVEADGVLRRSVGRR